MVSGPQIYIFLTRDSQSLARGSGPSFQKLKTHLNQQMHTLAHQRLSFWQELGIYRTPSRLRSTHLCIPSPELGDPNPSCKRGRAPACPRFQQSFLPAPLLLG